MADYDWQRRHDDSSRIDNRKRAESIQYAHRSTSATRANLRTNLSRSPSSPSEIRIMRIVLFALVIAASQASAATPARYVEFVNTARDSVTSIGIAVAGSDAYEDVSLGALPLQGGGSARTIEVAGESCLRDLRIAFANGRTLVHKDFDVCKAQRYYTGIHLRASKRSAEALVQSP
jgi:hypothetical protein